MSYQKDREEFTHIMAREVPNMTLEDSRRIMQLANRIQRLAAAECNGDWPCDNGERKVKPCAKCEAGYVPCKLNSKGICPSCQAEERIARIVASLGCKAVFSGDPRGSCVKIQVPSGYTNDWGKEGVCVPTREY